jgi:hypothetical protein
MREHARLRASSGKAVAVNDQSQTLNPTAYSMDFKFYPMDPEPSVRAGTLNPYLSATLKERPRARGAPIGYGHFPKN